MEITFIESQKLSALFDELGNKLRKDIKAQIISESLNQQEWLTLQEAQLLLPYKSKTSWQKLRDSGQVIFSKTGRLILYSRASILNIIKTNQTK